MEALEFINEYKGMEDGTHAKRPPLEDKLNDKVTYSSLKQSVALRKGHFSNIYKGDKAITRAASVDRLHKVPLDPKRRPQARILGGKQPIA